MLCNKSVEYQQIFPTVLSNVWEMMKNCSDVLINAFIGKDGVLTKHDIKIRQVFEQEDLMAEIEGKLSDAGYKTDLLTDEEHGLRKSKLRRNLRCSQILFDWNMASLCRVSKIDCVTRKNSEIRFSCTVRFW